MNPTPSQQPEFESVINRLGALVERYSELSLNIENSVIKINEFRELEPCDPKNDTKSLIPNSVLERLYVLLDSFDRVNVRTEKTLLGLQRFVG